MQDRVVPQKKSLWMTFRRKKIRMPHQENQQNCFFVTAASEVYARSLWQLLKSAERHNWSETGKFVLYDLGLSARSRKRTMRMFPWCEIRTFDFSRWPDHAAIEANTYAWKVFLLSTLAKHHAGIILWLDSATILHRTAIEILQKIAKEGVYTLRGQAPLAARCDNNVLKLLNVPPEVLDKPERVAGIIGLDTRNQTVRNLVADWETLALNPLFIPARRGGHNPEQALLSILLFQYEANRLLHLHDEEIDISSPRPVRWMSSRNLVSNRIPLFMDPLVRIGFFVRKTADRWIISGKQWYNRRIKGLHRWPKETYEVLFCEDSRKNLPPRRISPVRFSYYADPFPLRHAGRDYVFLEEFRYWENRGELVCVLHEGEGRFTAPASILQLPYHASFPYVFRHGGNIYLLPETSANKSIDLYVAEDFPNKWRLYRRLMYGTDAADSIIFRRGRRWWLITSERVEGFSNRTLALYWSHALNSTRWYAHPVNGAHLYGELDLGYGRNAGGILKIGKKYLRVMQKNEQYYGESLQLMEITELTLNSYKERPYFGSAQMAAMVQKNRRHHFSKEKAILFDRRSRRPFFRTIRDTQDLKCPGT